MLNKRTGHEPDHLVEKTLALDFQRDAFATSLHRHRVDRAGCLELFLSASYRERAKVVPANESRSCGLHFFEIDRSDQMPCAAEFVRRQDRCGPNPVTINFSFCRKAGMKIARDPLTSQDTNGGRQDCVQRRRPSRQRQTILRKIDMGTLRERVHAGISASRSVNANWSSMDAFERALKMILNPIAVRLALPACKWLAVVGND